MKPVTEELKTVSLPEGVKIISEKAQEHLKLKKLTNTQHNELVELRKKLKRVNMELESWEKEYDKQTFEGIKPIDIKLADAIIADLAKRVGGAIIDHIAKNVMENFKFIPAARNMTIRFTAKEALWTDPDSLQQLIVDEWKKHVAVSLKCEVENIDEHLRISLVIPQLRVSSRIDKKKKELPALDLDNANTE